MEALYAFMRLSDDLADEEADLPVKWERLRAWRSGLNAAMLGEFNHPVHPALMEAVKRFDIPTALLLDALDGVESDLEPVRFATFSELYPYCYRVASAVGLACVRVWGYRCSACTRKFDEAEGAAEAAGIAFQLTNILRDVSEDSARGRIYLPSEELALFGISPECWMSEVSRPKFVDMMRFQVGRAHAYYCKAELLDRFLSNDGRAIFRVMLGTYRRLLGEIERDLEGVLVRRIRVQTWRKGWLLLGGWAIKCGWM